MARHRWSGWPGAWCLDCGQSDPMEVALADDVIVFHDDGYEWRDEATKEQYLREFPPE